jgi:hypothetical protein
VDGLAILEKKTISVDLFRPLRNFIAFNYSEREAQNLDDDLQTLKQLRSDVERQSDSTPTARRYLLQNYFKALCLVETPLPNLEFERHPKIGGGWLILRAPRAFLQRHDIWVIYEIPCRLISLRSIGKSKPAGDMTTGSSFPAWLMSHPILSSR